MQLTFVTIKKQYETETCHIVRNASSIRCKNSMHGHSYKWFISIYGPVKDNGMVIDFIDLKPVKDFIDQFDHSTVFWDKEDYKIVEFFKKHFERVLVMKKNCTAENMATLVHKFVTDWLSNNDYSVTVEVFETRTGSAIAINHDVNDILIK